jgi:hypothetical protein
VNPEVGLARGNFVSVLDGCLGHLAPVEENAEAAVEVAEAARRAVALQDEVQVGQPGVIPEHQVGRLMASHPERAAGCHDRTRAGVGSRGYFNDDAHGS